MIDFDAASYCYLGFLHTLVKDTCIVVKESVDQVQRAQILYNIIILKQVYSKVTLERALRRVVSLHASPVTKYKNSREYTQRCSLTLIFI